MGVVIYLATKYGWRKTYKKSRFKKAKRRKLEFEKRQNDELT